MSILFAVRRWIVPAALSCATLFGTVGFSSVASAQERRFDGDRERPRGGEVAPEGRRPWFGRRPWGRGEERRGFAHGGGYGGHERHGEFRGGRGGGRGARGGGHGRAHGGRGGHR